MNDNQSQERSFADVLAEALDPGHQYTPEEAGVNQARRTSATALPATTRSKAAKFQNKAAFQRQEAAYRSGQHQDDPDGYTETSRYNAFNRAKEANGTAKLWGPNGKFGETGGSLGTKVTTLHEDEDNLNGDETPVDDTMGQPVDVNELAAALAALGKPEGENESVAGLQEEFAQLNECALMLAAKHKNQAREITLLKEQVAKRGTQLETVKNYLAEAAILTAKTALANQLLMENTTTKEEKVLIMESLGATGTRTEAQQVYSVLSGKLQKNSLITEQKIAQDQTSAVFSSETGLLRESVNKEVTNPSLHPMAAYWAKSVKYKSQQ